MQAPDWGPTLADLPSPHLEPLPGWNEGGYKEIFRYKLNFFEQKSTNESLLTFSCIALHNPLLTIFSQYFLKRRKMLKILVKQSQG